MEGASGSLQTCLKRLALDCSGCRLPVMHLLFKHMNNRSGLPTCWSPGLMERLKLICCDPDFEANLECCGPGGKIEDHCFPEFFQDFCLMALVGLRFESGLCLGGSVCSEVSLAVFLFGQGEPRWPERCHLRASIIHSCEQVLKPLFLVEFCETLLLGRELPPGKFT